MNNLKAFPAIERYLHENHVVSFTAYTSCDIWSASCFYAFDPDNISLIILTDRQTRHGQLMCQNQHVVGTISDQTSVIREIQGIQFSANAQLLSQPAAEQALSRYLARHPIAKLHQTDIWQLTLTYLKYTDNRRSFAHKEEWQRT